MRDVANSAGRSVVSRVVRSSEDNRHLERDWNHSKVLRKSSDDTRQCSANERNTVDTPIKKKNCKNT